MIKLSSVPIYINNINRLTTTRLMVNYLNKVRKCKTVIVDNNSSYPSLLDWYKSNPCEIIYLNKNLGQHAPWKSGIIQTYCKKNKIKWYVLTDSDLDLSGIPCDFLDYLINIRKSHPKYKKVGLGLRIDDLPAESPIKNEVINWEKQYWINDIESDGKLFLAPIDTTFALYEFKESDFLNFSGINVCFELKFFGIDIRTGPPYVARHMPWYTTPSNISEEEVYYINNTLLGVSSWGDKIASKLKI